MRLSLPLFFCLFLPANLLGDGMVIPTIAVPTRVSIPDQRALIYFTNNTERLVIETRFTGAGTNFAWVIPLPAPPVVEAASNGLFPTLQHLFRPLIRHRVPYYYLGILALGWLGYMLFFVRPTGRITMPDVAFGLFLISTVVISWLIIPKPGNLGVEVMAILGTLTLVDLLFILILVRFWDQIGSFVKASFAVFLTMQLMLVALSGAAARSKGLAATAAPQAVSVLQRKQVGVYETVTVASTDPRALRTWLTDNGYALSTNAEPVVAGYVKAGWVFVAAKLRRDVTTDALSTPHPLSFTFPADEPVYPLRLTGVDNGLLQVELFVFGPARARLQNFKVLRCVRPNYPGPVEGFAYGSPERPDIVHPLLRRWVDGAPVATHLVATLAPEQLQADARVDWTSFAEKRNRPFSKLAAIVLALNWGFGILAVGLAGVCVLAIGADSSGRFWRRSAGAVLFSSVAAAGVIYLATPKIAVHLIPYNVFRTYNDVHYPYWLTEGATLAEARGILANLSTNADEIGRPWLTGPWTNYILGGLIHEEDSPGNYVFREKNGQVQYVIFDAQGAEHSRGGWMPATP
jgi:hypothetical protein